MYDFVLQVDKYLIGYSLMCSNVCLGILCMKHKRIIKKNAKNDEFNKIHFNYSYDEQNNVV